MIKDLLVAIALGAVLGFGVTGGFFIFNKSNKNNSGPTPSSIVSIVPTQNKNPVEQIPDESVPELINENLNIESPKNESVFSTSKITIKGTSKPENIIIIKSPLKTYNLTVDKTGIFSIDIELETGINILKISAIDNQDNQTDTQLFITYSTSKF